jgi:hypothetical protein
MPCGGPHHEYWVNVLHEKKEEKRVKRTKKKKEEFTMHSTAQLIHPATCDATNSNKHLFGT